MFTSHLASVMHFGAKCRVDSNQRERRGPEIWNESIILNGCFWCTVLAKTGFNFTLSGTFLDTITVRLFRFTGAT